MVQRVVGSDVERAMGSDTGFLKGANLPQIQSGTIPTRDVTWICPVSRKQRNIMDEFTDLCAFLAERKKVWVLPILMAACSFIMLVAFTQGFAVDPFLSTLPSELVEDELNPEGFPPYLHEELTAELQRD